MSIEIYELYAAEYTQYANGSSDLEALIREPRKSGRFAVGDQATWELIIEQVEQIKPSNGRFRILDLGCGDGIWSLRLAAWLNERGFNVEISLVDSSGAMLNVAREYCDAFGQWKPRSRFSTAFYQADVRAPWPPEIQNEPWDLVLCLHTVINHITGIDRASVYERLFELVAQRWVLSVKPPGGLKTLYTIPMSDMVAAQQYQEEMLALDRDGQFHRVPGAPISAEELTRAFRAQRRHGELYALDVFTSRFRQATQSDADLPQALVERLNRLDQEVIQEQDVMNHANHILAIVY